MFHSFCVVHWVLTTVFLLLSQIVRTSRSWSRMYTPCSGPRWAAPCQGTSSLTTRSLLLSLVWQRRIWCREDCEHKACHPVLCNNCSEWGEEEGGAVRQNAGKLIDTVLNQSFPLFLTWFLQMKTCNNDHPAGNAWGSNHQRQPTAGGLWKCQDREEWQLLTLCKLWLWTKSLPLITR